MSGGDAPDKSNDRETGKGYKMMDEATRNTIRKLQATLIKIDSGVPVFFNITQYEKMGLVYSTEKHGKDVYGNDTVICHKWHLTEKAKQYIRVAV